MRCVLFQIARFDLHRLKSDRVFAERRILNAYDCHKGTLEERKKFAQKMLMELNQAATQLTDSSEISDLEEEKAIWIADLERIEKDSDPEPKSIFLGKTWNTLEIILGRAGQVDLAHAILGYDDQVIECDIGESPVQYLLPDQVVGLSRSLNQFPNEAIATYLRSGKMAEYKPHGNEDERDLSQIDQLFSKLKKFYQEAANSECCVVAAIL